VIQVSLPPWSGIGELDCKLLTLKMKTVHFSHRLAEQPTTTQCITKTGNISLTNQWLGRVTMKAYMGGRWMVSDMTLLSLYHNTYWIEDCMDPTTTQDFMAYNI
jgi:hypothetical protein